MCLSLQGALWHPEDANSLVQALTTQQETTALLCLQGKQV